MFPNVIQINVPYIQIYPFHGSNNLHDNDSVDLLIFKTNVSLQKLCISYESNGSKNDSALSIDKISDAQHAVECQEYRKDRGPKSMGPEPGSIVCKVDFKQRHLPKYLPRNSNSSQSKTTDSSAGPKVTLMPTWHAPEFIGRSNSATEQARHLPSNPFPHINLSDSPI